MSARELPTNNYYNKEIIKIRKLYQKVLTQDLENFICAETARSRSKAKNALIKFAFGEEKEDFDIIAELADIDPSYMRMVIKHTLKEFSNPVYCKSIRKILKKDNENKPYNNSVCSKYIKSTHFEEVY
ncbi:MAG: hypothetical protein J0G32_02160 [Alphaproteobacteria bacterium]|nr:hypothetical protein [Alphaproteobacteria bacterium]